MSEGRNWRRQIEHDDLSAIQEGLSDHHLHILADDSHLEAIPIEPEDGSVELIDIERGIVLSTA